MSRLQKKCLIASGTLHALLVLVLVLTSAFLVKEEEQVDQEFVTIIPDILVDNPFQHPAASQPAAAAPTPTPTPAPARVPTPQPTPPQPTVVRRPEPRPEPATPRRERVESEPRVDPVKIEPPKADPIKVDLTKRTVRMNEERNRQIERERQAQAEKQRQQYEQRQERMISGLKSLESRLSQTTINPSSVDIGTVGISYAGYDSWVRKVYMDSWKPPNDLPAGNPIVLVKVVIRRNGDIESAVISDASGVSKLDRNIRELLALVKTTGKAFPEGAREDKRTYTIEFNLKAINGAG